MNLILRQALALRAITLKLAVSAKPHRIGRVHRSVPRWADPTSFFWPAMIVVAVVAAFQNGRFAPFLLDDEVSILNNESIRHLTSLSAVLWPRTDVFTAGRPLLNLSFALNHAVGGTNVLGYHLANIAIHAAAALVLFGVVRRTLLLPFFYERFSAKATVVAFAAALLWALHPLQTESVTYLSQRAESLMGLCYLGALYGFIRAVVQPRSLWPVVAIAACGAGMLVKEVMVTAPVLIFLFDRTFISGSFKDAWRSRHRLHLSLAATWLVLLTLMIATRIHDRGVGYGFSFTWHRYLRIEFSAVLHYLRLCVMPFGLTFDYGEDIRVPSRASVAACALALGAILFATLIGFRRRSALGFLGCWFFLILAPTSSFLPVAGQPIAENRLYLPLAAVTAILAAGGLQVMGRRGILALLAVAGSFLWLTVRRNHDYRSELAIWADTVERQPDSARAQCYYGLALTHAGKTTEAARCFERALQITPQNAFAHLNLGCVYAFEHRFEDAIRHFEAGIVLRPNEAVAHNDLGSALFQVGRKTEALAHYQEALRLRPQYPEARVNLGIALAQLGRTAEAQTVFEETLRQDPGNLSARRNLDQLRAQSPPSGSSSLAR